MAQRYVKVDLERDECEAIAELADVAVHQILVNQQFMPKAQQDRLRAILNSVKMKMGVSAQLFGGSNVPSIILPGKKGIQ